MSPKVATTPSTAGQSLKLFVEENVANQTSTIALDDSMVSSTSAVSTGSKRSYSSMSGNDAPEIGLIAMIESSLQEHLQRNNLQMSEETQSLMINNFLNSVTRAARAEEERRGKRSRDF